MSSNTDHRTGESLQSSPIYSLCTSLRSRLLTITGFSQFFELTASGSVSDTGGNPVTQLWDLFSLGTPLCYLFNLLPSSSYPRLDFATSATVPDEHTSKIAIAKFALYVRQNFPTCESFCFSELLNRNSTDGIYKAINAVNAVLDKVPKFAGNISPPLSPKSFSKQHTNARMSRSYSNSFEHIWNTHVQELLTTERSYIRNLETIQQYAGELVEHHSMDTETANHVFPQRFFTFQRKHRIKLESIAELPWKEQRWGRHFIESATDLSITYQIYCVNRAIADTEPKEVTAFELRFLASNPSVNSIAALLRRPFQQLVRYTEILESLLKVSGTSDHPFHEELQTGCATLRDVLASVDTAQKQAVSEHAVNSLCTRVEDWKGIDVAELGRLVLSDIFNVERGPRKVEEHIFLFQHHLLFCNETPASESSTRNQIGRRKRAMSAASTAGERRLLAVTALTPISDIIRVTGTEQRDDPLIPPVCELTVITPAEYLTVTCQTEEQLRAWQTEIDRLRIANQGEIKKYLSILHPNTTPPPYTPREKNSDIMIKVHSGDSVFSIAASFPVEYEALMEKVERKLRLCTSEWFSGASSNLQFVQDNGLKVPLTAGVIEKNFLQNPEKPVTVIVNT